MKFGILFIFVVILPFLALFVPLPDRLEQTLKARTDLVQLSAALAVALVAAFLAYEANRIAEQQTKLMDEQTKLTSAQERIAEKEILLQERNLRLSEATLRPRFRFEMLRTNQAKVPIWGFELVEAPGDFEAIRVFNDSGNPAVDFEIRKADFLVTGTAQPAAVPIWYYMSAGTTGQEFGLLGEIRAVPVTGTGRVEETNTEALERLRAQASDMLRVRTFLRISYEDPVDVGTATIYYECFDDYRMSVWGSPTTIRKIDEERGSRIFDVHLMRNPRALADLSPADIEVLRAEFSGENTINLD